MKIKISMRRKVLIGIMFTSVLFGMGAKFKDNWLRLRMGETIYVVCKGSDLVVGGVEVVKNEHGEIIEFRKLHCDE